MNIIKFIGCFIIAIIAYLLLGLIAWNIVCSIMDYSSCTLTELEGYKIFTYSAVTFLCCMIIDIWKESEIDGDIMSLILAINGGVAYLITVMWNDIWISTSLVLTILYNLVNICIITHWLFASFND